MNWILQLVIAALLGGVAFLCVAAIVPGFRIRGGFGTAVAIAAVYGLMKALLQGILIVATFPLVLITLGLFIVVINAFLLWLTNRVMHRLEVRGAGALLFGSLLLSLLDLVMQLLLRGGAIF